MPSTKKIKPFEFRKVITNEYHLKQISLITEEEGNIKPTEVCWRLLTEAIELRKKRRELKS